MTKLGQITTELVTILISRIWGFSLDNFVVQDKSRVTLSQKVKLHKTITYIYFLEPLHLKYFDKNL